MRYGFLTHSYATSATTRNALEICAITLLAAVTAVVLALSMAQEALADSNNAAISYRSNTGTNTLNSAKYREWNPSTLAWGSEVELPADPTSSNIRFAWTEFSPISSKRVVVTLQDDGTLDSYVCSVSCTSTANWMIARDVADLWSAAPAGPQRPFDLEFEKTSGDLLLIYDKVSTSSSQELFYRTMAAGAAYFGSESSIDDTTTSVSSDVIYSFIRMDSQKTASSDVLGMIALDQTNTDVIAWRWDGTTWGNLHELTSSASIGTEEAMGVAFETNSGDMVIVAGEGTAMRYNQFSSGWGTSATFGTIAIGNINWVSIKADPVSTSSALFVLETGDLSDMDSQYWSGSAWTDHAEHDAGIDGHAARVADFAWDNTGNQGVLVWGTASGRLDYKRFSGTSTFAAQGSFTETSTHPWVQLSDVPNPTSGDTVSSLGATNDATNDIGGIRWNGGTNNPVSTTDGGITSDTTVTAYENFKAAWQRSTAATSWSETAGEGLGMSDSQAKGADKKLSENLELTDAIQAIATFVKQLNESVALADTRVFGSNKRISENMWVSDDKSFATTRPLSETVSLTDSLSTAFIYAKSLSENLEWDDQFAQSAAKSFSEALAHADGLATISQFSRTFTENVDITTALTRSIEKGMPEELTASDSRWTTFGKPILEDLRAAESVTTSANFAASLGESLETAAATLTSVDFVAMLVEPIATADSSTRDPALSFSDGLGISDGMTNLAAKWLEENAEFDDLTSTAAGFIRSVQESLSFNDVTSVAMHFQRGLSENLEIEQALAAVADYVKPISESLAVADSLLNAADFVLSTSELLGAADDVAGSLEKRLGEILLSANAFVFDLDKVLSEVVEADDSLNAETSFVTNLGEGLSVLDQLVTSTDFARILAEGLGTSELIVIDTAKSLSEAVAAAEITIRDSQKLVTDRLNVQDALSTATNFVRSIMESVGLTAVPSLFGYFTAGISESLHVGDAFAHSQNFVQSFAESLASSTALLTASEFAASISERVAAVDGVTSQVSKALNDAISAKDLVSNQLGVLLGEGLALADSVVSSALLLQEIDESLAFEDLTTFQAEFLASMTENLGLSDASGHVAEFIRTITENIATQDSVSIEAAIALAVAENLGITDEISTFTSLGVLLGESLGVADDISDVFLDIRVILAESLAMAISFFTPEVGYQSSLVSEAVSIADTVEIVGQQAINLSELLTIQDLAESDVDSAEPPDDVREDDTPGNKGTRKQYHRPLVEGLSLADTVIQTEKDGSESKKIVLLENLAFQEYLEAEGLKTIQVNITGISTGSQILLPSATASVSLEIFNNLDSPESIALHYRMVEETTGISIYSGYQEVQLDPSEIAARTIQVPISSPGNYVFELSAESMDDSQILYTASKQLSVSWTDVYISLVVYIVIGVAAASLGRILLHSKDGKPLGNGNAAGQ
jgi:hypothetical protein